MEPTAPPNPTIAVVDDDECVRNAIANLVRSLGHAVATFDSAEAFLDSPACATAACLISDIQMPGMSGLDLQRHLATTGNRMPIILMTAFPKDLTRAQATAGGALAYLAKPFDSSRLIELIEGTLADR